MKKNMGINPFKKTKVRIQKLLGQVKTFILPTGLEKGNCFDLQKKSVVCMIAFQRRSESRIGMPEGGGR
jgi:hypothetical protein